MVLKKQKGQASIMVAMMMTTFILLFAFVVNTGMLVNAKINLQNAADLAAYAGASVQARQLNRISFLNYEMLRQYKKFLFRYYVVGTMAQDSWGDHPTTGTRTWYVDSQTKTDFQVPVVCITLAQGDNHCHVPSVDAANFPGTNFFDQINDALHDVIVQLENLKEENCGELSNSAGELLGLWLTNTDPELKSLQISNLGGDAKAIEGKNARIRLFRSFANGLGLIPKELLLRQRIQTLEDYLNAKPGKGLSKDTIDSYNSGVDPSSNERSIQAYLSAWYTLGDALSSLTMDELISDQGVIALKDVKQSFDTYFNSFEKLAASGGGFHCVAHAYPLTIHNIPLGVSKDPAFLTYYAVKLSADAKVLFSPWGPMHLKAYSAARPFGSRIGPPADEISPLLVKTAHPPENLGPSNEKGLLKSIVGQIPDLKIQSDKPLDWYSNEILTGLYNQMNVPDKSYVELSNLERGYQAAMSPYKGEELKYNIPVDLISGPSPASSDANDKFIDYFDSSGVGSLWAPVASAASQKPVEQELKSLLDQLFYDPNQKNGGEAGFNKFDLDLETRYKNALLSALETYLGRLRQGQGEVIPGHAQGEGNNVAQISDSLHFRPTGTGGALDPISLSFGISEPATLRTSWVDVNDKDIVDQGRVGYSVKFVSFDSLANKGSKTKPDGQASAVWDNEISQDSDTEADLPYIKH